MMLFLLKVVPLYYSRRKTRAKTVIGRRKFLPIRSITSRTP